VSVALHQYENHIVLDVSDTGIGMSDEEVKHVFSKFYRSADARKKEPNHSGLGLFIANRIIEGHKGTLNVESTKGSGTNIRITLPRATENNMPPHKA